MKKVIRIGNSRIGDGQPIYIIAEIGVTCNYDITLTKELIDAAREAGADAVKLIFWFPEEIMSDKTINYTYETSDGWVSENMFEMLSKLQFSYNQWKEVKEYAEARSIGFFSTVNSPSGIAYAETLGLDAYKLSSWDYNYHPLWKKIARLGRPMLIDTGPVTTIEVAKVMQIVKDAGNDQAVLVHCLHTDYHWQMNIRAIPYMRSTFDTLVGYSSKDRNDETDIMAVTLGACVLEKRLTMNRYFPGHHHYISKEPDEFYEYVEMMRDVQAAIGNFCLSPSEEDLAAKKKWFRHLVANQDLSAGTILTEDMLEGKRPMEGISPEYLDFFVGRTLKRNLEYNEAISWEDV